MLKDPWLKWESGGCPYEALSNANIMVDSNMNHINDAPFDLIVQGLWTNEARLAWDQLRTVEKRLWVDFLLYPWTAEEILGCLENAGANQQPQLPAMDFAQLLTSDLSELELLITQLKSNQYHAQDPADVQEPAQ